MKIMSKRWTQSLWTIAVGGILLLLPQPSDASSIAAPGFGRPIIINNDLFTVVEATNELLCYDLERRSIKWRRNLGEWAYLIANGREGELVLEHKNAVRVVSTRKGEKIIRRVTDSRPFGASVEGWVYSIRDEAKSRAIISCWSYSDNKVIWEHEVKFRDATCQGFLCDTFVVALCTSSFVSRSSGSEESQEMSGDYYLLILDRITGRVLNTVNLDLKQDGLATSVELQQNARYVLSRTGGCIRLFDANTAQQLGSHSFLDTPDFHSMLFAGSSLRDACFWGVGKVVAITETVPRDSLAGGTRDPRVYVLTCPALTVERQFSRHEDWSGMAIRGDMLYINALTYDLLTGKQLGEPVDHSTIYSRFGSYGTTVAGEYMYIASGKFNYPEAGSKRILGRIKLGTPNIEILIQEENPVIRRDKENAQPPPST